MPRTAGVSFSCTVWRIRRSPRPRTTCSWLSLNPIGLFTSVTFTVAPFVSVRWFAMMNLRARLRELLDIFPAQPRDQHRVLERRETSERRAHNVVRVRRPERLGQDVR